MDRPPPPFLEALSEPTFLIEPGPQGAPVFALCNSAWYDLMGMTPGNTLERTIAEVFPGTQSNSFLFFNDMARTVQKPVNFTSARPIDGVMNKLKTHLTPMFDENGSVGFILGTTHDVSRAERADVMEMQHSKLGKEIELLTTFLSNDLLAQLHQVREVAAALQDGFVDLGDGKLQQIVEMETCAETTSNMVSEVVEYARLMRMTAQTDTFLPSEIFENEFKAAVPEAGLRVTSDAIPLMAERETLRSMFRILIESCALETATLGGGLRVTADTDCPGMVSLTVEAPRGLFDLAIAVLNSPMHVSGPGGEALLDFQDMVRARGGELFAERTDSGDLVQFTIPGYVREREHGATMSA